LQIGTGSLPLAGPLTAAANRAPARDVLFGIRPEDLRPGDGEAALQARILDVEPLGAETIVRLCPAGLANEILMRVPRTFGGRAGETATIAVDLEASHLFNPVTTRRI